MAPDTQPAGVRIRFTSEHEDAGVLYQPGQEADVAPASAVYIEHVARSGHRVTPETPAAEPTTKRGLGRGKE